MRRSITRLATWAVLVLLPIAGVMQMVDRTWRPLHYHAPLAAPSPSSGVASTGAAVRPAPAPVAPRAASEPVHRTSALPAHGHPAPAHGPVPVHGARASHDHAGTRPSPVDRAEHRHTHGGRAAHRHGEATASHDADRLPPSRPAAVAPVVSTARVPEAMGHPVARRHHHGGDARDVVYVAGQDTDGPEGSPERPILVWTLVAPTTWVGRAPARTPFAGLCVGPCRPGSGTGLERPPRLGATRV